MSAPEVKVWEHARKGRIVGVMLTAPDVDWADIRLVGDQRLGFASITIDPNAEDGEIITVRTSMLTEITEDSDV